MHCSKFLTNNSISSFSALSICIPTLTVATQENKEVNFLAVSSANAPSLCLSMTVRFASIFFPKRNAIAHAPI